MARYIDETNIYNLFNRRGVAQLHVGDIDVLPREDVVPVIHARWSAQVYDPNELPRYKCSNCNEFVQAGDDRKYCPSCGARMDGR